MSSTTPGNELADDVGRGPAAAPAGAGDTSPGWRAPDSPGRTRVTDDPAARDVTRDSTGRPGPPTAGPPVRPANGSSSRPPAPGPLSDIRSAAGSRSGSNGAPRPLAPPAGWSAGNDGPGSPAGSVRPPDTTGTVSAPSADRRHRGRGVAVFLAALLGAGVGTVGTLVATDAGSEPDTPPAAAPSVSAPRVQVQGDDPSIVSTVAAAVTPSVVRIDVLGEADGAEQELGLGSGVVYRSDGHIITNNHVVQAADALRVKLASGEEFPAELVGTDPLSDLAVVKINATGLPAITLREGSPTVGETAIAIGSPFGLDASVTAGVVSAVGRDITVPDVDQAQVVPAVIQTDAAINPGNSGGALVDQEGRLLGINTAILSGSGGSQGVGFAIPTAQAMATADQLIETGEVRHALLGVSGVDVTAAIADRLDLDEDQGALIQDVNPGSGAAEAGLQVDDVIRSLGDRDIATITDLVAAVRAYPPGESVTVTYVRDGEEVTAEVVLGERDDDD